jgi:hypothetical protein
MMKDNDDTIPVTKAEIAAVLTWMWEAATEIDGEQGVGDDPVQAFPRHVWGIFQRWRMLIGAVGKIGGN